MLIIEYSFKIPFFIKYKRNLCCIGKCKFSKKPVEIFMVQNAIQACAAHHVSCNNNMEIYSIKPTGEIKEINYTCTIKRGDLK